MALRRVVEAEIRKDERQREEDADDNGERRFRPSLVCRFERVPRFEHSVFHGEPKSGVAALTNHQVQTLVHFTDCLVASFHGCGSGGNYNTSVAVRLPERSTGNRICRTVGWAFFVSALVGGSS